MTVATRVATLVILATGVPSGADADVASAQPLRAPGTAAGRVRVEAKSGLEFVAIPAGSFHFGCEPQDGDCSDDERPGSDVTVGAMWLGKTEVTVDAFARCVAAGACAEPASGGACNWGAPGRERHPINCVDFAAASAFCQYTGGRLPTAQEWEYAAKGGTSRIFPWSDDPVTDRRANFADVQYKKKYPRSFDISGQDDAWIETAPVGTYPAGASLQGLLDMVGNVIEWTSSDYQVDLTEVRGGGWSTDTVSRRLRPSYRTGRPRSARDATLGLRCRLAP